MTSNQANITVRDELLRFVALRVRFLILETLIYIILILQTPDMIMIIILTCV